jgi:hypothetical protein
MVAAVNAAYLPAFDRASLREIAPECRGVSVGCVVSEIFSDGVIICEFILFSMCENLIFRPGIPDHLFVVSAFYTPN